jgi:hypothetical protein
MMRDELQVSDASHVFGQAVTTSAVVTDTSPGKPTRDAAVRKS